MSRVWARTLTVCLLAGTAAGVQNIPVVLWHGMGDSCCNPLSMGAIKKQIETDLPGAFVLSVRVGETIGDDVEAGFYGNVNEQVQKVCDTIAATPELSNGYNAVGFSQGGQFLRAVAQRCHRPGGPAMKVLVTMGGQHQGVSALPGCENVTEGGVFCQKAADLAAHGAYAPWVRDHIVQAQYFKDPAEEQQYLAHNPFLPDINNERVVKNATYAANLASLERLVLMRFAEDITVVPRDSSWFGLWDGNELVPVQRTALWREDWIGLRALAEAGRLDFVDIPGAGHMQFSLAYFSESVIRPYLAGGEQQQAGGAGSAALSAAAAIETA